MVLDETGLLKKGRHSAGVARQYSGTAGRMEHCQIGVLLAYASAHGHALLDRDLSLPQEWTQERERGTQAGMPPERPFATKPALARHMLERALQAGVPATWVPGESVYGDERRRRLGLEAHAHADVLAVSGKEYVWLGWQQRQGKTLLARLPAEGWQRHSAGAGAKGPRWYDWCGLPWAAPMLPAWRRWLLVRRSVSDATELTAFVVCAPQATTLAEVVQTAGPRWTIESRCEAAKGEVGLDHYEVRSWTGWDRHITWAMGAYALLAVGRARHLQPEGAVPQKMLVQAPPNRLAACKAVRSRGSPCVLLRFAASCGASCSRPSRRLATCWSGPPGDGGTKAWHNFITTNGVQAQKYNCSTKRCT
jgi:SRSO17 transposase